MSEQAAVDAPPRRPLLLGLIAFILRAQAALLPFLYLVIMLQPGDAPISVADGTVPLSNVRIEMTLSMLAWFGYAAFVGTGLWRGWPRARDTAAATFVIVLGAKLFVMGTYPSLVLDLLFVGLVAWYLYAKPNVVAFFDLGTPIEARIAARANADPKEEKVQRT